MIKQARVEDIANRRVTKIHGRIVVVTQYYPRFLKRNLIHEYIHVLAPTRELLKEFKGVEKACGDHDGAFANMDYESKFAISESGWSELERLSLMACLGDVYLICHCVIGQCCHRELLMLAAQQAFGVAIGKLSHAYPVFRARLTNETPTKALALRGVSLNGVDDVGGGK